MQSPAAAGQIADSSELPRVSSLTSLSAARHAVAVWKADWASINAQRKIARVCRVGVMQNEPHSSRPELQRHSSPHSSTLLQPAAAAAPSPLPASPVKPVLIPAPSPPRSQHGHRLLQAANLAAARAAAAKLPINRRLEGELTDSTTSPLRPAATASRLAASSPSASFAMKMLRAPSADSGPLASSPAAAVADDTPHKRARLAVTGSPAAAAASTASSAASSPCVPACPPRPFYSMPARPLSASELFPRSSPSPPPSRSVPQRSPSRSTSSLFGALLSGSGSGSGGRKRLRSAASLTPGLHNGKGIYSLTIGSDHPDDRAKGAHAQREYEAWMQKRRNDEAASRAQTRAGGRMQAGGSSMVQKQMQTGRTGMQHPQPQPPASASPSSSDDELTSDSDCDAELLIVDAPDEAPRSTDAAAASGDTRQQTSDSSAIASAIPLPRTLALQAASSPREPLHSPVEVH